MSGTEQGKTETFDLIVGVPAITKFYFGEDATQTQVRRTYGWCESGAIPAFKVGKSWCLRPEVARADAERRESRQTAS